MAEAAWAEIERLLGHEFRDRGLLREALSHPSLDGARDGRSDYDRLEFLGDRVLGLLIAERLFADDAGASAGDLAVRFNTLVRKETVAEVARGVGLGAHLRMAPNEAAGGGRDKPAILANACEAVLGALYLDGGLEAASRFVEAHWRRRLLEAEAAGKDPKTQLQELVQGPSVPPPSYRVLGQEGPAHDPVFTVEVEVCGRGSATGRGSSRRRAEQDAAASLLRELLPRP